MSGKLFTHRSSLSTHCSLLFTHVRGQIDGADGDAIENIARYMSRAAISVDRVEFNPEDNTLTVAHWGGNCQTSSRKSENSNSQYPGYHLLGFNTSCGGLLP